MGKHDEIMAITTGFMKSRTILTAAEWDFFTSLHEKPVTPKELADSKELDERATTRILDCLITFGLLEKHNGRYLTTEEGSLLSTHHRETILPMVLHMNHLWETWSSLTDTLRQGKNPERTFRFARDEEAMKAFIGAMHVIGQPLSREIAEAYDLTPYRKLLDVGGASGTYTMAFLKKNPRMKAVLFDLPNVIPMAEVRLGTEDLQDRVELVSGDFYKDELPQGCDLTLLSAIIHQNSPKENVELYRRIYRALEPGGVVLIRDHIMDESRTSPPGGALFALNMLVNTSGGDTYTFSEIKVTLEEARFMEVKLLRVGERMDCLVEARKPL